MRITFFLFFCVFIPPSLLLFLLSSLVRHCSWPCLVSCDLDAMDWSAAWQNLLHCRPGNSSWYLYYQCWRRSPVSSLSSIRYHTVSGSGASDVILYRPAPWWCLSFSLLLPLDSMFRDRVLWQCKKYLLPHHTTKWNLSLLAWLLCHSALWYLSFNSWIILLWLWGPLMLDCASSDLSIILWVCH